MLQFVLDLQSGNNDKIKQAEAGLSHYQLQDVAGFCTECINIMNDNNATSETRQFTGTLLRRTVLQNINSKPGWEHIPQHARESIKNSLAQLLECKDRKVKRATADIVSAICAIEVPKGEWPNIIPNLITNVSNSNVDIKEASLMALGFISQLMKQRGTFLDKESTSAMFAAIVGGIKDQNPSISQLAMNAFINCIHSCQDLFQTENVRNVVLEQLVIVVQNSPVLDSKKLALQSLAQMVKEAYYAMESSISPLLAFTLPLIKTPASPDLCIGAMEIWSSLLEQHSENQKSANYIKTDQAKTLAEALMTNMTVVEEGSEDDQEDSIRGTAYRTLCYLGEFNSADIYQLVINFVAATISDGDWIKRQASIKAFTSLLDGMEGEEISKLSTNALSEFLKLLNDNSVNVQASAAFSLSKISEKVPEAFINHGEFTNVLKLLVSSLDKKAEISKNICSTIGNLFDSEYSENSQIIVNCQEELMSALFNTGMRTNVPDGSLAGSAFLAALLLTAKVYNPVVAFKYIQIILQGFPSTYQITQQNIRHTIHSGILSVLQAALHTVSRQLNSQIDQKLLDSIFQLITNYFQKIGDVDTNGIYILAQLSNLVPETFPFIQSIWQYVLHALKRYQDCELFKATIVLIGDLSRKNPNGFAQYSSIIDEFIKFFNDPNFNIQSKISIITFFADLFLSCPAVAMKYQERIYGLLGESMAACVFLINSNFDYADNLREILIDTTSAILHSVSNRHSPSQKFLKIVPSLVQFIKLNNTVNSRPTIRLMRDSMFLCLDLIQIYDQKVKSLFQDTFLVETLTIINKHNTQGQQQDLLEFAKAILQVQ